MKNDEEKNVEEFDVFVSKAIKNNSTEMKKIAKKVIKPKSTKKFIMIRPSNSESSIEGSKLENLEHDER